jgi:hypothetical protein
MRFANSGILRVATSLILLALLLGVTFIGFLPQLGYRLASADSNIVQYATGSNIGDCSGSGHCSIQFSFGSPVTAGDVVVVLFLDEEGGPSLSKVLVTDTLGSTFSSAAYDETLGAIYVATLASSGSDAVNVTDNSDSLGIQALALEVSGVSSALNQTSLGSGTCTTFPCDIATPSISFLPGAFLASIVFPNQAGVVAGTGFNLITLTPDSLYAQYSSSSELSSTDFNASIVNNSAPEVSWFELGIVLEPLATTSTVSSFTTTTTTSITTTTSTTSTESTSTTTSTTASTSTTTSTSTLFVYPTTTHVSCKLSKAEQDRTIACTAIVSSKNGGTPTGTVTYGFTEGALSYSNSETCNALSATSCYVTFSIVFPACGNALVFGAYSGDQTHQPSHGATIVRVTK